MAKIPELTADMEVIQKLGRRPNVDDGLTEAGFKAKFDEAGIAIKKFINEKVVPAINDYVVSTDGLLDRTGGTMTGNIAMSGNKVTGLGAPSVDWQRAVFPVCDHRRHDGRKESYGLSDIWERHAYQYRAERGLRYGELRFPVGQRADVYLP